MTVAWIVQTLKEKTVLFRDLKSPYKQILILLSEMKKQGNRGFLSKLLQWGFPILGIPNGCKSVSKRENKITKPIKY